MSEPRRMGFPAEGRPQASRGRSRGITPPVQPRDVRSPAGAPVALMESLELGVGSVARGGHSPGSGSSPESRHSGNGNGGNGGSPPGERGTARGRQRRDDYVHTRGENVVKRGTVGEAVTVLANYFQVQRRKGAAWRLFKYRVDFNPDEDRKVLRKAYQRLAKQSLKIQRETMFDGQHLFIAEPLPENEVSVKVQNREGQEYEVRYKLVEELNPTDPMYVTFYNIILKNIQEKLELTEMGRSYFDHGQAIHINEYQLELWPGFVTTLKQHENELLMCVEVTHKVLRKDNVLDVMQGIRERAQRTGDEWKRAIENELVGTVVMTTYNKKTYRVDGVDWNQHPTDTFEQRGQAISFMDYFRQRYKAEISSTTQPMLVSNPKARDIRRGVKTPFLLVPQLCRMTGLNDTMRADFQMMRRLAEHLHSAPQKRVETICRFVNRIVSNEEINNMMLGWNLRIAKADPVQIQARVLKREEICFGNGGVVEADQKADWTMAFRSQKFLTPVPMGQWAIIVPQNDRSNIDGLVRNLQNVARPLNFPIGEPVEKMGLQQTNPRGYSESVRRLMDKYGGSLSLIFVVLARNNLDTYAAVKQSTFVDYGIPSQCFLSKNLRSKGLMSIATKVVVQMNAKLGGEPWAVKIPLKKMMVVGFDVYHATAGGRRGQAVGGMCATTNANYTKYFSTVSYHSSDEELSQNVCSEFTKCLQAFQRINGELPERIVFFRDGVGAGQLRYVYEQELERMKDVMKSIYGGGNPPKFTFIVVSKRINTRIFAKFGNRVDNPSPGTVVDDVVTLPERFDFFMIPQSVRQGTVSPTSFNVLFDTSGLTADRIQMLTYKFSHLYYNWSGTVAVPAPVQYAHKLALLTGTAMNTGAHHNLASLLYFL